MARSIAVDRQSAATETSTRKIYRLSDSLRLRVTRCASIPGCSRVKGEMTNVKQGLSSIAAVIALSLVCGCEKRFDADAARKMTNTGQGNSAEGLAIVGFFAMKKLRDCSERLDAYCAFRYEPQPSGIRPRRDPSSTASLRNASPANDLLAMTHLRVTHAFLKVV